MLCRVFFISTLSAFMLNVIMLSVVAPSLNVAANLVISVNVREIPYRK